MKERLRAGDYRFILICAALLAVTTWFSVRNFHRAFPEASIDFKVSRDDAQTLAANFLHGQGYALTGFRHAAQFSFDEQAKTFLEREAGLERANQLMGTRVRIWRWSYRWFKPLTREEFNAEITPTGQLAGFEHEIAEAEARGAVTVEQARAMAEDFLATRMGRAPGTLEFVEGNDVARPHRVDRTFTWKERGFSLRDATLRVEVTLLGNEIGSYREYLKVPEQWKRDYQLLRSRNEVAQTVDGAVLALLIVCMVIVIVMRVRHHDVPWRRSALVGLAGIVLGFLAQLNEFPLHEFGYPTTDSYESFVSRQILNALLAALGAGGLLFVLTAGAEPLYREMFGEQISLGNLFTAGGLGTKRFFKGTILGIALTGIFIAYQTAFYILASKHGAWSPAEVPYTDMLNTKFPWAFVLFGGFLPAVSEEFLFRMFAIPFLRKATRSVVAALILAGFIWGFGHAGYPQQPFYIRGLEVGIGGVALGIIMLRFGILPTLVWHYSVDAMYSAMLLVRSESLYYKLSGLGAAGIMLLPLGIALVCYWRRGGFLPDTGLLNRDETSGEEAPAPPSAPEEAAPLPVEYRRLSTRTRWIGVALLVAGLATLAVPVSRFAESPNYKLSPEEAQRAADSFLKAQGVNPADFRHVTYPSTHWDGSDPMAAKYFLERLPVSAVSSLFERYRPMRIFLTRYFKPLNQEELTVAVHAETGKVTGFTHSLPEDRAGADISPERAREVAAQFAASQGWDTAAMELKDSGSEKKKARRDHALQWEARPGDPRNVGETKWRVAVTVAGDRVTEGHGFWKLPEAYERTRGQQNAIAIAVAVAKIAALAGLIVWAIGLLILATRHGEVRWRATLLLALPATLLFPLGPLLKMGLALKDYRTDVPLETFQAMQFVVLGMSVLFGFLVLAAAAALVTTFYPAALPALRRKARGGMAVDAVAALAAGAGLSAAAHQLQGLLLERFHAQAILNVGGADAIAGALPALAAIAGAARGILTDAAVVGLLAVILHRITNGWLRIAAVAIGFCALLPGEVRTAGEFALHLAIALLMAGAAAVFCWGFARRNYVAYALALWMVALRGPAAALLGTGNSALAMQGWIVVAAMVAGLLWVLAPTIGKET